ncbi:MAG TPA: 16S rRNA (cytidine(1402)-2'-O)-methyltransferase [Chthoniobacterales bacterium]
MLYVVATPIGNLGDLTFRALEALRGVDFIAAEDTRHSSRLLSHYEIRKPLVSLHDHNESQRVPELAARLEQGENAALISDAGMPLISDPGFRLLQECIARGLPYEILPGPSAVTTALAGSGLPCHAFFFGGFLPQKSGRRARELERALARDCTSIYFESPHRLVKSLAALAESAPDRRACVARELTKTFQEYRKGSVSELQAHYEAHPPKGEITLLVAPASGKEPADPEED